MCVTNPLSADTEKGIHARRGALGEHMRVSLGNRQVHRLPTEGTAAHLAQNAVYMGFLDIYEGAMFADVYSADAAAGDASFVGDGTDDIAGLNAVYAPDVEG